MDAKASLSSSTPSGVSKSATTYAVRGVISASAAVIISPVVNPTWEEKPTRIDKRARRAFHATRLNHLRETQDAQTAGFRRGVDVDVPPLRSRREVVEVRRHPVRVLLVRQLALVHLGLDGL